MSSAFSSFYNEKQERANDIKLNEDEISNLISRGYGEEFLHDTSSKIKQDKLNKRDLEVHQNEILDAIKLVLDDDESKLDSKLCFSVLNQITQLNDRGLKAISYLESEKVEKLIESFWSGKYKWITRLQSLIQILYLLYLCFLLIQASCKSEMDYLSINLDSRSIYKQGCTNKLDYYHIVLPITYMIVESLFHLVLVGLFYQKFSFKSFLSIFILVMDILVFIVLVTDNKISLMGFELNGSNINEHIKFIYLFLTYIYSFLSLIERVKKLKWIGTILITSSSKIFNLTKVFALIAYLPKVLESEIQKFDFKVFLHSRIRNSTVNISDLSDELKLKFKVEINDYKIRAYLFENSIIQYLLLSFVLILIYIIVYDAFTTSSYEKRRALMEQKVLKIRFMALIRDMFSINYHSISKNKNIEKNMEKKWTTSDMKLIERLKFRFKKYNGYNESLQGYVKKLEISDFFRGDLDLIKKLETEMNEIKNGIKNSNNDKKIMSAAESFASTLNTIQSFSTLHMTPK